MTAQGLTAILSNYLNFTTQKKNPLLVGDSESGNQVLPETYTKKLTFPMSVFSRSMYMLCSDTNEASGSIQIVLYILIPVVLCQSVLLLSLWNNNPPLSETSFCEQWNPLFYWAIIFIFLLYVVVSCVDTLADGLLVFASDSVSLTVKDNSMPVKLMDYENRIKQFPVRTIMSILVLIYEIILSVFTVVVGVNYIFSQSDSISNSIQATVAIVFIGEIDNVAERFLKEGYNIAGSDFECIIDISYDKVDVTEMFKMFMVETPEFFYFKTRTKNIYKNGAFVLFFLPIYLSLASTWIVFGIYGNVCSG